MSTQRDKTQGMSAQGISTQRNKTQGNTPRMTYTETNAAGLITDKRNVTKMLLEYLSREYPAPIVSFSTPKFKQDRQKIV